MLNVKSNVEEFLNSEKVNLSQLLDSHENMSDLLWKQNFLTE